MNSTSAGAPSPTVSRSSFLRFAVEIRQNIYGFVLPDKRSIHVKRITRPISAEPSREGSNTSRPSWWFLACDGEIEAGDFQLTHSGACKRCCSPELVQQLRTHGKAGPQFESGCLNLFRSMTIDLKLLRTCQQIRSEASHVLFSRNHFHFPKALQFSDCLRLPGLDFSAIRSISILLGECDSDTRRDRSSKEWRYCKERNPPRLLDHVENLITRLPGITDLTVYATFHGDRPVTRRSLMEDETLFLALDMLSKLPLEKASVKLDYFPISENDWEWFGWDDETDFEIVADDATKLLSGDTDNLESRVMWEFRERQKLYGRVKG